jgi:hypothetical protein
MNVQTILRDEGIDADSLASYLMQSDHWGFWWD